MLGEIVISRIFLEVWWPETGIEPPTPAFSGLALVACFATKVLKFISRPRVMSGLD
jgi:hypothetical protein